MVRRSAVERLRGLPRTAAVLATAGVVRPYGPRRLARLASTVARWGTGPAGGYRSLATRFPHRVGLVDELGALTFGQIHERTNALAHALADRGVGAGDTVAVMARNHRGFVEATVAAAKLGADVLYLDTGFAAPQVQTVLEDPAPAALVYDEEFADRLAGVDVGLRLLAWCDAGSGPGPSTGTSTGTDTLESLIRHGDDADLVVPQRRSRTVILTSGSTGKPKRASRAAGSLDAAAALLSALPLRQGWTTHVAVPLFHTWGWAHLQLSLLLGSTLVLRRRFDPFDCVETVSIQACDSLVVTPVMMQRILRLSEEVKRAFPLETVRTVTSSGSALPGDLALEWMDTFGDTLYNVYGCTECPWAAVATPADLRDAPGTAGRPPTGTELAVYDDAGREVPPGRTGRVFVGDPMLLERSGGGRGGPTDHLMATGDLGRIDADGRLFIVGREDDIIVSGGEKVFPQEVEQCLARHPDVLEAAVVGVPDADLGQRLRAFVVLRRDGAVDQAGLQEHVKARLGGYQVPREVLALGELPRNSTGKVVRSALAAG